VDLEESLTRLNGKVSELVYNLGNVEEAFLVNSEIYIDNHKDMGMHEKRLIHDRLARFAVLYEEGMDELLSKFQTILDIEKRAKLLYECRRDDQKSRRISLMMQRAENMSTVLGEAKERYLRYMDMMISSTIPGLYALSVKDHLADAYREVVDVSARLSQIR
jgi:hypothetical protein